jgi:hypothetical protein
MLEHELHVLMGEAEIQKAFSTFDLLFHCVFIEVFNVILDKLNANFRIINLRSLCFLIKLSGMKAILFSLPSCDLNSKIYILFKFKEVIFH